MYAVPYLTVPAAELTRPGSPSSLVMALAAHPERWRPLLDYRPDTRWYRLLERTERHEVWLLSWLPGQGTGLHDHGPASGAFAVAAGALTERVVTIKPGRPPVEVTRSLTTGRCRAFGPNYVHQVTNAGTVPAVSVHVYTPELAVMNRFQMRPGEGLQHVAVEQAGVDW
jgi:predicted metal-dependent enzyme (double-stranded beta helix superfamily)